MRPATRTAMLAAVLVLGLAACDDGPDGAGAGAGEVVATFVAVDVDFAQTPGPVPAGEVTVELVNEGDMTHNITIEGAGDGTVVQADGAVTATGVVTLDPGEHVAYCSIAGHREAGMEATLTVEG